MLYLFKTMFFNCKHQILLNVIAVSALTDYDVTLSNFILLYIATFILFYGTFYSLFTVVNPKALGRKE